MIGETYKHQRLLQLAPRLHTCRRNVTIAAASPSNRNKPAPAAARYARTVHRVRARMAVLAVRRASLMLSGVENQIGQVRVDDLHGKGGGGVPTGATKVLPKMPWWSESRRSDF